MEAGTLKTLSPSRISRVHSMGMTSPSPPPIQKDALFPAACPREDSARQDVEVLTNTWRLLLWRNLGFSV